MSKDRPYITYGKYVLTADPNQWIVAVEGERESGEKYLYDKTFHKDPASAIRRLADRKMRNVALESLEEFSETINEIHEYFKSKFNFIYVEQND